MKKIIKIISLQLNTLLFQQKKMQCSKLLIVITLLALIVLMPQIGNGQTAGGITASTNKSEYQPGDKVIITGKVQKIEEGQPVTILIRNPIYNVYDVGQVDLQNDIFVHDFVISNNSKPGDYTIQIKYANQSIELHFTVTSGLVQIIPVGTGSIKVMGNEIGLIKYKKASISIQDFSIIIGLDSSGAKSSSVEQEFEIPKEVIDASGSSLIVQVDDNILKCTEKETSTSRILDCLIPTGSQQLKFIGTSVIPEFGPMSVVILMVSVSIIIVLSRRIKLGEHFYK